MILNKIVKIFALFDCVFFHLYLYDARPFTTKLLGGMKITNEINSIKINFKSIYIINNK